MKQVWGPKGARWLKVGGAALAVVWGTSWWGVPYLVKQQVQAIASEKLGRAVTVREVTFAPWSLQLTLKGVEVAGPAGAPLPQLQVERLYVDADISSVWHLAPVLDAVQLDAPVVRVTQAADGQWDFADVLAKLAEDAEPEDPQKQPVGFALYNIAVQGGRLELHDQQAGAQHVLEDLQLQLPFISNLDSKREVKVLPELSMKLNGSQIATEAVSTPFAPDLKTQAQLRIQDLDFAPWLPYLPSSLPVRVQSGGLDAALTVAFEQTDRPTVQVQGTVTVHDVHAQDVTGQPLLQFERLEVGLADVRPLQQHIGLSSVRWVAPQAQVVRRADGRWQLLTAAGQPVPGTAAPGVPADAAKAEATSPGWSLALGQFDLEDGLVSWRDAVPRGGAALQLQGLQVHGQQWAWPLRADARVQLQAQLHQADGAAVGQLEVQVQGTPEVGRAAVVVQGGQARALAPYAAQWLRRPVEAQLDLTAGVAWHQGQVQARIPQLQLHSVVLGSVAAPEAGWSNLTVRDVAVDVTAQQVHLGQVTWGGPYAKVRRDAQGRWMFEHWLQPALLAPAARSTAVRSSTPGRPWQVAADEVQLQAGVVEVEDATLQPQPLALRVSDLRVHLRDLDTRTGKVKAQLDARMAERTPRGTWGRPGQLAYDGQVRLDPLTTEGRLRLNALPLQTFEPYVAPYLNVHLVRALAGFEGQLRFAQQAQGPQVQLQGNARLSDVHVQTLVDDARAADAVQGRQRTTLPGEAEDLLRWKQLALQGVKVHVAPGQRTQVAVRSTALQDFYARVVVLPQGRLNLQNLVKGSEEAAPEESAVPRAEGGAEGGAAVAPASVAAEPAARIEMGPMTLRNGVIKFSDYFIQPNYSADLTALQGRLEAFSSEPVAPGEAPALAALSLEGVAQGSASLHIAGAVNPVVQPLALDVRAQVQGLDLSPLTPYAIKYAGHGIERGKLSMDVRYQVQPDGQLTASNQLVLNQLNFGDAVEGAPNSLPVRLAVALLADSQGVIDLNLPISGSLNDPQFRIAPVVFKILGNIIRKAVTAPFSLLTGALADADEQSDIRFLPGRVALDEQAQARLDTLAQALKTKPQLKLTLVGEADTQAEVQGWKAARLEQWIEGQVKVGDIAREAAGTARSLPGAPVADGLQPAPRTEQQRLAALKEAYRHTVKDRPRNMVGLPKELPPAQMRALILQDMAVPEGAWEELATARAHWVRGYLLAQGVDEQRVFLGRSSVQTQADSGAPRVLLNISVQ